MSRRRTSKRAIAVVKRKGGFFPTTPKAVEDVAKIPDGKEGLVLFWRPRNLRQHNLAWALADKLAESQEKLLTDRQMMDILLEETGHYDVYYHPVTGEMRKAPRSIAFASMEQEVFDEFFKAALHFAITEILPGVAEGALKREINIMVGVETLEDNLREEAGG